MTFRDLLRFLTIIVCAVGFSEIQAQSSERDSLRRQLAQAAAPFEELGNVIRLSVELAGPSIVHIESKQLRALQPNGATGRSIQMEVEESGSGIVVKIAKKNVILTNRHVVEGIELASIKIQTHDRRRLTPTKVRTNADFDLAVVEVAEETPPPALLDESDRIQVGQIILAVGSPFGLDRSVSMGIVSATNRRRIPAATGQTPIVGFFQIDAAVNPGSSGGPMLNLRGEVVGMITAIATQGGGHEGVAFVLPMKIIKGVAEQLVRDGIVMKPFIGLGFEADFDESQHKALGLDRMVGAKISHIAPDSPASQAGLQIGDVLLKLGDTEIEDDIHVVDYVARSIIDQAVPFQVLRDGRTIGGNITPAGKISH